MKRLLFATASVLAFMAARPSLSADLGPVVPVYTPPVAPVALFTWTGCYLGGHIGAGFGRKIFSDTPTGTLVTVSTGSPSVEFHTSGFLGGGQVGCNYQFAQSWVIGVEGEISGADLAGSQNFVFAGQPAGLATFHAKSNWLASATGRVGYAAGPWLFYAKGGGAWTHDKYSIADPVSTWTASGTRSGWTAGVGFEYAMTDRWSFKFEYDFYDFAHRNLTFVDGTAGSFVEDVKQQIHAGTFSINYRFGPGQSWAHY